MSEKRHTIQFRNGDNEVTIETDYLSDLSSQPWFTGFLSLGSRSDQRAVKGSGVEKESEATKVDVTAKEMKTIYPELNDKISALSSKVDEVYKKNEELKEQNKLIMEENQAMKKVMSQDELKHVAEQMGKEFQNVDPNMEQKRENLRRQQQQNQQNEISTPRPPNTTRGRLPESNFLSVTPDSMSGDIWNQLSEDQQQEWLKKYNMA